METITVGGAMLGNCAIGRVLIPSTPRNKRMMEMTIASAGRWRILVNMVRELARCVRFRERRQAVAILRDTFGSQGPLPAYETRIPPCRHREPLEPLPGRSCPSRRARS